MADFKLIITFILFLQCYALGNSCKLLFQPKTFMEQVEQHYPEIKRHPAYGEIMRLLVSSDPQSRNSRLSGEPNLMLLSEQAIAVVKAPLSAAQKNQALTKIVDLYQIFDVFQNTYLVNYESKLFLKSLISNPANFQILQAIGRQAALRYEYRDAVIDTLMKTESEIIEIKELDPQSDKFRNSIQSYLTQLPTLVERRILDKKNELREARRAEAQEQKKIEAAEKLRQRIKSEYKKVSEQKSLDPALRRQIDIYFETLYNPRFAEILEKLTRYNWFMKQSPDKQIVILFMLNGMVVKAYASTNETHQALLTHTINFIVNGYFPVIINHIYNAAGRAHLEFIEINSEEFIQINTGNSSDPALITKAADFLAHEVSHTISRQRVEESYSYFIEEYRAFQVGHFASTGKLMTDREALRLAFNLIINKYNSRAYEYIKRDFLKSFESSDYKYFFRLFNLDSVTIYNNIIAGHLTDSVVNRYVETASDTQTAPQLGWPGFITNSPKPNSNDRYLQREILRQ